VDTYIDILKHRIKKTRGQFVGWQRGGPLNAWYAVFANRAGTLFVPLWCMTRETRAAITPQPKTKKGVSWVPAKAVKKHGNNPL
jgi:hypothetical protein